METDKRIEDHWIYHFGWTHVAWTLYDCIKRRSYPVHVDPITQNVVIPKDDECIPTIDDIYELLGRIDVAKQEWKEKQGIYGTEQAGRLLIKMQRFAHRNILPKQPRQQ